MRKNQKINKLNEWWWKMRNEACSETYWKSLEQKRVMEKIKALEPQKGAGESFLKSAKKKKEEKDDDLGRNKIIIEMRL